MDEEFARLFQKPREATSEATWQDVAHEFEVLGKSLGDAVQAVWQRRENRERVRDLQDSLQSLAQEFHDAIEESVATAEAQQAREQFTRVSESVRVAVERSAQELGPEVLGVLRQINDDIRRLVASPQ